MCLQSREKINKKEEEIHFNGLPKIDELNRFQEEHQHKIFKKNYNFELKLEIIFIIKGPNIFYFIMSNYAYYYYVMIYSSGSAIFFLKRLQRAAT